MSKNNEVEEKANPKTYPEDYKYFMVKNGCILPLEKAPKKEYYVVLNDELKIWWLDYDKHESAPHIRWLLSWTIKTLELKYFKLILSCVIICSLFILLIFFIVSWNITSINNKYDKVMTINALQIDELNKKIKNNDEKEDDKKIIDKYIDESGKGNLEFNI